MAAALECPDLKKGRKGERGEWQPLPLTCFLPPSMLDAASSRARQRPRADGNLHYFLQEAGLPPCPSEQLSAPRQIVSKTIPQMYHLLR